MKDKALLVVAAIAMSALAWAFWHYSAEDGFEILTIIVLIVFAGDNYQLRKKLKAKDSSTLH